VGTKVWGSGANASSAVSVAVDLCVHHLGSEITCGDLPIASANGTASKKGDWQVSLPDLKATKGDYSTSVRITVSNGEKSASISDVAVGDVLLCGGQSNMGFGMCGVKSPTQSAMEALDALPPLRFFLQQGSGPHGGAGQRCRTSSGNASITPKQRWFTARAENAGGASAVCMLTAQRLFEAFQGEVPVGAVESCISGTYVEPWTPPTGTLWLHDMVPLLPMTFRAAIWDQGEADAKRTNSSWYAEEFPRMIQGWRDGFEVPLMPFFYVELCTEYGASEPNQTDFWLAQRRALQLPNTGFAVTTDVQRTLHPPNKQEVATRLALEVRRVAYGESVVSRGPELVSAESVGTDIVFTFSNETLSTHAGIMVGNNASCRAAVGHDSVATDPLANNVALNYTIVGSKLIVKCASSDGLVRINADSATCFLYGPDGLPAPPVQRTCTASKVSELV